MKPIIYYSQNREDITLSAFFPDVKKGFYVDVGACDPVKFSVTNFFYKKGWNGINIEPQDRPFRELVKHRKRDINLKIGIADKPGELKLRVYDNESLSTFAEEVKNEYDDLEKKAGHKFHDEIIPVRTLADVFKEYKVKQIQFLKVDVEGLEELVLKGNDWNKYKPEVLCIEANNLVDTQNWHPIVEKAGYEKVFFDGLNDYFVPRGSSRATIFRKEYQRLIVAVPSLAWNWEIRMHEVTEQLERVQKSLDAHIELRKHLEARIEQLEKSNKLIKKVKSSVKKVLKIKR